MKTRSIVALLLVLCSLMSIVACKKEPEETYSSIDYLALDLTEYVKLGTYRGVEVAIDPLVVDISSISDSLQDMIDEATTFEEYSTPVTDRLTEAGDYVEINFKGYMNGELFEGGSADGVVIMLADNNGYVDWLDDDLYGIMPGTSVETKGFFPEDYHYTEYAGKEVTFRIDLLSIKGHYSIPALDDAFIAERTEYDTVEAYRTAKQDELIAAAEEKYEMLKLQTMWQTVMEGAEIIKLPEEQIMYYYTTYRSNAESYAEIYDYTYEEYLAAVGITDEQFRASAESMVTEELIFYAIVKAEGYTVSDEEYDKNVKIYAEEQGMTVEALEEAYGKEYIIDNVLWDKVMYELGSHANYVEKES